MFSVRQKKKSTFFFVFNQQFKLIEKKKTSKRSSDVWSVNLSIVPGTRRPFSSTVCAVLSTIIHQKQMLCVDTSFPVMAVVYGASV